MFYWNFFFHDYKCHRTLTPMHTYGPLPWFVSHTPVPYLQAAVLVCCVSSILEGMHRAEKQRPCTQEADEIPNHMLVSSRDWLIRRTIRRFWFVGLGWFQQHQRRDVWSPVPGHSLEIITGSTLTFWLKTYGKIKDAKHWSGTIRGVVFQRVALWRVRISQRIKTFEKFDDVPNIRSEIREIAIGTFWHDSCYEPTKN